MQYMRACMLSRSVVSNFLRPHGLYPANLPCKNFPVKNTGVGFHALLQGIFLAQGSNPHLMFLALAGGFFTTETCTKT